MGTSFDFQIRGQVDNLETLALTTSKALVEMESSWTRFCDTSELMLLNKNSRISSPSFNILSAVSLAFAARRATQGVFDPKVHDTLVAIGYDRSFKEINIDQHTSQYHRSQESPTPFKDDTAIFDIDENELIYQGDALDLGGIGKGLALRNLSSRLVDLTDLSFLIDAGGDIVTHVASLDNQPWFIDVENPASNANLPIAIRSQSNAVVTSSIKVRSWTVNGQGKHHLIDPFTRDSSESDLASVTVVGKDPAWAEVYSKAIFLKGSSHGFAYSNERRLAALLILRSGEFIMSKQFRKYYEATGTSITANLITRHTNVSSQMTNYSIST